MWLIGVDRQAFVAIVEVTPAKLGFSAAAARLSPNHDAGVLHLNGRNKKVKKECQEAWWWSNKNGG
jgi:hypothetical protein